MEAPGHVPSVPSPKSGTVRPCSHLSFYPTRVPFANGTRRVVRVHTASTASGSSGTLRPHRQWRIVGSRGPGARNSVWPSAMVRPNVCRSGTLEAPRRSPGQSPGGKCILAKTY